MNCKNVVQKLPDYLSHTLGEPETVGVRAHLDLCLECREESRLLSASWDMLGLLEPVQPSAYFHARFWEKVRQQENVVLERTGFFAKFPFVPALAGFFVLWVLGVAGGARLFAHRHETATPMEIALNRFTSPYPQNSIEIIFQEGRTPTGRMPVTHQGESL
ncbi:MAG: zf-HC2 domain-containing protein [Elusimicrobia bacterium]|nr:zf-HC2 domain-containing protein [Elusimicrobiota bacterium]